MTAGGVVDRWQRQEPPHVGIDKARRQLPQRCLWADPRSRERTRSRDPADLTIGSKAGARLAPADLIQSARRARSSVGERSLHTREVAGSSPAVPILESPGNSGLFARMEGIGGHRPRLMQRLWTSFVDHPRRCASSGPYFARLVAGRDTFEGVSAGAPSSPTSVLASSSSKARFTCGRLTRF